MGIALLLLHRTAGSLCRLGAYSKAAVFLCSYRRLASRAHSPPRVSKHDLQRIGRLDIHRTSRARMGRGTVCAMEESVVATLHHAGVRLRYLGDGLGENLGVDDRCELAEHRDGTSSARCAACVSVTPTPPPCPAHRPRRLSTGPSWIRNRGRRDAARVSLLRGARASPRACLGTSRLTRPWRSAPSIRRGRRAPSIRRRLAGLRQRTCAAWARRALRL